MLSLIYADFITGMSLGFEFLTAEEVYDEEVEDNPEYGAVCLDLLIVRVIIGLG